MLPRSATPATPPHAYVFGPFRFEPAEHLLVRAGQPVTLPPKGLDLLAHLVSHAGRLVTKEELLKDVWPDTFVEEANLSYTVSLVRKALGDDETPYRFIETVPKRGYRFIAQISNDTVAEADGGQPALQTVPATPGGSPGRRSVLRPRPWQFLLLLGMVLLCVALTWRYMTQPSPVLAPSLARLTANSDDNPVNGCALSKDGRHLAYSDRTGIHVKTIASGETHTVLEASADSVTLLSNRPVWNVVDWFPDGTTLLVGRQQTAQAASAWLVSVLGGSPIKLRDDATPQSVSPDGSYVAFTAGGAGGDNAVWLMTGRGENPRRLVHALEGGHVDSVIWSADAHRIAYLRQERDRCAVETRSTNRGDATLVLSLSTLCDDGASLWWLPDGRIVFPMREPPPNQLDANLWTIGVDASTGRRTAPPKRLTSWPSSGGSSRSGGASIDGLRGGVSGARIVFVRSSSQSDAYVAVLEADGTSLRPPHRLTLSDTFEQPMAWSRDGTSLFIQSDRRGRTNIFRQNLDDDNAAPVAITADDVGFTDASADAAWLVYASAPRWQDLFSIGPVHIRRVPPAGGPSDLIADVSNYAGHHCPQRTGSCVLGQFDRDQLILYRLDPLLGKGRELARVPVDRQLLTWWCVSPDGSQAAVVAQGEKERRIRIVSLVGGGTSEIPLTGWNNLISPRWSPDGRGLFVASYWCSGALSTRASRNAALLYVHRDGTTRVLWEHWGWAGGIPSPDGRRLALQVSTIQANVWMLEHF